MNHTGHFNVRAVPLVALIFVAPPNAVSVAQYYHNRLGYDFAYPGRLGDRSSREDWQYDAPYYNEREWFEPRRWFGRYDYEYDPYTYNRSWGLDHIYDDPFDDLVHRDDDLDVLY